jgi:hypothetical protein
MTIGYLFASYSPTYSSGRARTLVPLFVSRMCNVVSPVNSRSR